MLEKCSRERKSAKCYFPPCLHFCSHIQQSPVINLIVLICMGEAACWYVVFANWTVCLSLWTDGATKAYNRNVSSFRQLWAYMNFQCVLMGIWPHFSSQWHGEEFEKSPLPSCGMWAPDTAGEGMEKQSAADSQVGWGGGGVFSKRLVNHK